MKSFVSILVCIAFGILAALGLLLVYVTSVGTEPLPFIVRCMLIGSGILGAFAGFALWYFVTYTAATVIAQHIANSNTKGNINA